MYLAEVGDGRVGETEDTIGRVIAEAAREGGHSREILRSHRDSSNVD